MNETEAALQVLLIVTFTVFAFSAIWWALWLGIRLRLRWQIACTPGPILRGRAGARGERAYVVACVRAGQWL